MLGSPGITFVHPVTEESVRVEIHFKLQANWHSVTETVTVTNKENNREQDWSTGWTDKSQFDTESAM